MKPRPEMVEGPDAFARFQSGMQKIMLASKPKVLSAVAELQKEVSANPNRRGPKGKPKLSA